MYYTNELTITMENEEMATKALEVLVKRLKAGFEIDKTYRPIPSISMAEDLEIENNTIVLPDECGYYCPEDANDIFVELFKDLAAILNVNFSCSTYNNGDYAESGIEATFVNGILKVEETFVSYCDTECDEDEDWETKPIVTIKEIIIK